jgi:hypothetical protein
MAEAAAANAAKAPEGFVADAGYDTYEGAQACARMGSDAVVAPHDATWQFWSVDEGLAVRCPLGHPALPSTVKESERGGQYLVLRVAACRGCPFYEPCCGPSGGHRTLSHPVGCDPVHRLRAARLSRSALGRESMRTRMATVETLFGNVKWNMGLRRFATRGLAGARTEWTLALMAWNLRIH